MLKQRIIIAAILMPLVIVGICYLPLIAFDLTALLVVLLAAWEFSGFFSWSRQKRIGFLVLLAIIALFLELAAYIDIYLSGSLAFIVHNVLYYILYYGVITVGTVWWLMVPYFLRRYEKTGHYRSPNSLFLGILIFIPCWTSIAASSRIGTLELLAIVWAADIGAYFTGKFFGKHLLAPKISPAKTVEGICGGVLASLLINIFFIMVAFYGFKHYIVGWRYGLVVSVVVSLWSVVGDLFESMLKRQAGVKDSSKLLPGHGGIYDRIDSLTAAAPIFALAHFLDSLIFRF